MNELQNRPLTKFNVPIWGIKNKENGTDPEYIIVVAFGTWQCAQHGMMSFTVPDHSYIPWKTLLLLLW